ncbi:hypothetical protein [Micromonospora aurantiaca (nom. illeg.)]|uniref:hypothetical protein n=1 Tax=Micromonospora aurantiaca (nom. illeg.) TaxID=47850 RepID=UPI0033FA37AA
MSFYAASGLHEQDVFTEPKVLAPARGLLPPLTVDDEACLAWRPDDYSDEFVLPRPDAPMTTLSWARLVFAAFQPAAQANHRRVLAPVFVPIFLNPRVRAGDHGSTGAPPDRMRRPTAP